MKNHLLVLIVLITACTTDVPVPCGDEGPVGTVCREYRYFNDVPKGFVTFNRMGDTLAVSNFYNEHSGLVKTVTEQLENGQTTLIAEQFPKKPTQVQTWHYNELDSLWKIVFGANDSVLEVLYEGGKRFREAYYHAGELNRFFDYRYYQDDGKLYRVYAYGKDSILQSYRHYEYFSTGQNRVSTFTANNALIGRRVYRSENGLLSSIQFTDSAGTITQRADYVYNASFNLIERTQREGNQTYKSVFLYY